MQRTVARRVATVRPFQVVLGRHCANVCTLALRVSRHCPQRNTAFSASLHTQARMQSAVADKKFHCSVCNKAFRLEMAAKVHIQQAHSGNGTVEVGAGPGQDGGAAVGATVTVPVNAPPQGPTVLEEAPAGTERPLRRRSRPTPKPLHDPYNDVPPSVLDELLAVWDDVGVRRLAGSFVHSSMVMKVFAADPDAGSEPLYDPVEPEGENPFASAAQSVAADVNSAVQSALNVDEQNIYAIDLSNTFAFASDEYYGPFRVAKCDNPYDKKSSTGQRELQTSRLQAVQRPQVSATPVTARGNEAAATKAGAPQAAAATPFGQLPLFVQESANAQSFTSPMASAVPGDSQSAAAPGVVASPFASATTDSPFAQPVTSPFVASPFDAAATGAPDASAPPSPFTMPGSPFAAAAAASPFVGTPFAALGSVAASADVTGATPLAGSFAASGMAPYPGVGGGPFALGAATAQQAAPEMFQCDTCKREFSSYDGMRMHAKAKHGVEIPARKMTQRKKPVPDLPAYIPSPVDLSMTSPFSEGNPESTWEETELTPHAVSVSNITISGQVLDVEVLKDNVTTQLTVFVAANRKEDCETLTVRWVRGPVSEPLSRKDRVFVSGTLRLVQTFEPAAKKHYLCPIIFVGSPTGFLQKIG